MSLLSGIFGGGPKPTTVKLDNETNALIGEDVERAAHATPESIARQNTMGVEQGVHQLDAPSTQGVGTGENPNLVKAIQNRYRAQTAGDLSKFQSQAGIQAKFQKAQMMSDAAMQAQAKQKVQMANYEMLAQAYQQNKAARAQMISGIIGAASTAYMINKIKPPKSENINQFSGPDNVNTGTSLSGFDGEGTMPA